MSTLPFSIKAEAVHFSMHVVFLCFTSLLFEAFSSNWHHVHLSPSERLQSNGGFLPVWA